MKTATRVISVLIVLTLVATARAQFLAPRLGRGLIRRAIPTASFGQPNVIPGVQYVPAPGSPIRLVAPTPPIVRNIISSGVPRGILQRVQTKVGPKVQSPLATKTFPAERLPEATAKPEAVVKSGSPESAGTASSKVPTQHQSALQSVLIKRND